jgi:hypothetical protein
MTPVLSMGQPTIPLDQALTIAREIEDVETALTTGAPRVGGILCLSGCLRTRRTVEWGHERGNPDRRAAR